MAGGVRTEPARSPSVPAAADLPAGDRSPLGRRATLFVVRGIPVGMDWSWLFIVLLVFWSLARGLFPTSYPGRSDVAYLAMGAVGAVLLFASVLAHELSHSLRALREGVRIKEISLWLFGGVAQADQPLPDPGAELRVVLAGPAASAVLAGAFLGLAGLAGAAGAPVEIRGVLEYAARMNGLLLGFNLVPALPLDGGRIFHAYLWRRHGDRSAATLTAALVGRTFGILLVTIGALGVLTGGDAGGLWFMVLGWFVLRAATQEGTRARLEQVLAGVSVGDVLRRGFVTVPPDDGLRRAARPTLRLWDPADDALEVLAGEPGSALVLDGAGRPVGLLTLNDLVQALETVPRREPPPAAGRAAGLAAWLVVGLALVVAAAALYHPPYVVIAPGAVVDVGHDVAIAGVPVEAPTGRYQVPTARVSQPSALGLLWAAVRDGPEIRPASAVMITGVSRGRLAELQRQLVADSRQLAAAAAAAAAGHPVTVSGAGAEVLGVVRSAPAASVLKAGDVITAVAGVPVTTTADFHRLTDGYPADEPLRLVVRRAGREHWLTVTPARPSHAVGGAAFGILLRTRDLRVELPFTVSFRDRPELDGPGAGLAYALAIADMLDATEHSRGRAVAATGVVLPDGTVRAGGAPGPKAVAARGAGAALLLVPAEEAGQVGERGLAVHGVGTVADAVRLLQAR